MKIKAAILFASLTLTLGSMFAGCGSSSDFVNTPSFNETVWSAPDPNLLATELRGDVEAVLQANNVPGALVAVITPRGRLDLALGLADVPGQRPAHFDDRSAWRSVTKSFTVTVVMQLASEGLIDLDEPISEYLTGVPNGDKITARHLANMTSGLFDYSRTPEFLDLFAQDLTQPFTTNQLLGFAFSKAVQFEPGQAYDYSNTNTLVLEKLVEEVTGSSLPSLIQARLLNPVGMNSTVYLADSVVPAPLLKGYTFDTDLEVFEELLVNGSALGGAGAMAGPPSDLASWGRALVSGTLLPTSLQQQRFVSRKPTNGPRYDSYGMGLGEIRGWWGHTGTGLGYQACVFSEPRTGSTVVVLINATNQNADVPADLFDTILDTLGWPARG